MSMPIIDRTRRSVLAAAVAAALLSACALTPQATPELDLPAVSAQTPAELDQWWQSFRDPVLDALIAEALERNDDVVIAAQRVQASRATLDLVRINRLPDASLSLSGSRQQYSNERPIPGRPRQYNTVLGGISASYELDLFGRLSGQRDVARQQLAASRAMRWKGCARRCRPRWRAPISTCVRSTRTRRCCRRPWPPAKRRWRCARSSSPAVR